MKLKVSIAIGLLMVFSIAIIPVQQANIAMEYNYVMDVEVETEENAKLASLSLEEYIPSNASLYKFGLDNIKSPKKFEVFSKYTIDLKVPDIPPELNFV